MQNHDDLPKVEGGKLTKPYPIKTAGDVQRARVLPPPRMSTPAPTVSAPAPSAPARRMSGSEQPKSGFDYIRKRNALSREVSGRR